MIAPESKTVVLTIRVTPAVMALLEARAVAERRPVRSLAAMILEDALKEPVDAVSPYRIPGATVADFRKVYAVKPVASILSVTQPQTRDQVTPRFKKGKA